MAEGRSVLVLNMGSSSLKWVVLDAATETTLQDGDAHWDATAGGQHHAELTAALSKVNDIAAVGHRVVHGGQQFREGVLVDDRVREEIGRLAELAPLHNPAALAGMDAAADCFPGIPHVAAFDTSFHRDIPEPIALYPVPWDWTTRWNLRRYGFHGLSVSYAVERAQALLGHLPRRVVVCHLGAGCSVTAVEAGRSINTSMGFTPLEGVMMTQRSGSVDPGLLLYLLQRQGIPASEGDRALNEASGLLGVSGVGSDLRQVQKAARHNARARLAIDMFVHRLVESVGGMVATLRGLDALIFTGGIGEHSVEIRAATCAAFSFMGMELDASRNELEPVDRDIARPESAVRILVVRAREELSVLREIKRVLNWT
jgi:acetate kinase